jgi:hypothetical protein
MWQILLREMQVSPHALPVLQILQQRAAVTDACDSIPKELRNATLGSARWAVNSGDVSAESVELSAAGAAPPAEAGALPAEPTIKSNASDIAAAIRRFILSPSSMERSERMLQLRLRSFMAIAHRTSIAVRPRLTERPPG